MESKVCQGGKFSCGKEKPLSDFPLRSGTEKYRDQCKSCQKEYKQQYYQMNKKEINAQAHQYYQDNREKTLQDVKQYRQNHKGQVQIYQKQYQQDHKNEISEYKQQYAKENILDIKEKKSQYYQKNKYQINESNKKRRKQRRKTDPIFKFHEIAAARANHAIKKAGGSKNGKSTKQFLPQPAEEVLEMLQMLFTMPSNLTPDGKVWMTLDNWKRYNKNTYDPLNPATWTWNLDHIEPAAFLPYKDMECENFQKCWDKTNLRPLLAKQNIEENDNRTLEQIAAIKDEIQQFLEPKKKVK